MDGMERRATTVLTKTVATDWVCTETCITRFNYDASCDCHEFLKAGPLR